MYHVENGKKKITAVFKIMEKTLQLHNETSDVTFLDIWLIIDLNGIDTFNSPGLLLNLF